MNKPTNKYWQKRFELLTESLLNKGERYTKDLTTEYEKSIVSIQSDIQKFYSRFAQNNSMTLAESKKLLNSKELQEFHWTVEEYIQKGKENAINQLWMKELENASTRVRVKRLEALQYQIRQQIEMITARRLDGMNRLSDELIKDGYYKSIYEIQKGFGIGNTFSILDTKIIENIISKPWAPDGSNFSSRIWRDRDVLVSKLQTELAQTFIRGDAPDTAIRNISKTMDVSRRSAGRLVMTESAYFSAAGQKKAYQELEIEEYEIVATLDTITSDLCQSLDGNVLPMSEYSPGTTAPPFHPYCRTVTVPYFSDNDTERFARGIDGKGYKVPGDMKYKEWYQKHVVAEYGQERAEAMEKMIKNKSSDKAQYARYKEVLGKEIPKSFDKFQELKYNNSEEWKILKADYRKVNAYNKIIANEPPITSDLQTIAKITKTNLVGLEYRIKSKESYLRKVNMDSNNTLDSIIIDDVISNTKDVIRYTYQSDYENLVQKYMKINGELKDKGYELVKVKNTWLIKGNPYKGINCNYKAPSGIGIEIQYHTPESFELKNGQLHKLYEEWRDLKDKTSDHARSLSKEMAQLSSKLKIPNDIDRAR